MADQIDQTEVIVPQIPTPMRNVEITDKENTHVSTKMPPPATPKVKRARTIISEKPVTKVCSRYMYSMYVCMYVYRKLRRFDKTKRS